MHQVPPCPTGSLYHHLRDLFVDQVLAQRQYGIRRRAPGAHPLQGFGGDPARSRSSR
jgi:hypothetical protein